MRGKDKQPRKQRQTKYSVENIQWDERFHPHRPEWNDPYKNFEKIRTVRRLK